MTNRETVQETLDLDNASLGDVLDAAHFAADKHRNQRRKDAATPYINHPIALANLLWNEAHVRDAIVIIAALLHDTVEDTETTFAELEQRFGAEVMSVVREVTDDKSLPKQARKRMQIDHAAHLSDRAKLVKLADKISNLRDILISPPIDWSIQRRQEYFAWGKAVIDQLRGTHDRLEHLFDTVYQQGIQQLSQLESQQEQG